MPIQNVRAAVKVGPSLLLIVVVAAGILAFGWNPAVAIPVCAVGVVWNLHRVVSNGKNRPGSSTWPPEPEVRFVANDVTGRMRQLQLDPIPADISAAARFATAAARLDLGEIGEDPEEAARFVVAAADVVADHLEWTADRLDHVGEVGVASRGAVFAVRPIFPGPGRRERKLIIRLSAHGPRWTITLRDVPGGKVIRGVERRHDS